MGGVIFFNANKVIVLPVFQSTFRHTALCTFTRRGGLLENNPGVGSGCIEIDTHTAHSDVSAQVLLSYWLLSTHVQPGGTTFDLTDWWCWQLAEGWPRSDASSDLQTVVHWSPKRQGTARLHTCEEKPTHPNITHMQTQPCIYTCTHAYTQSYIQFKLEESQIESLLRPFISSKKYMQAKKCVVNEKYLLKT